MNRTWLSALAAVLFLVLAALNANAFSLLGPFESWMTTTNGFFPSDTGDIGGPVSIGNGYRWNVPTLTYGFDQSFLDFFGTNGVAAVEGAVQILNSVPPASQMILTNYPHDTQRMNFNAEAQGLWDLRSRTLSLLLEHMGLAQPLRFMFVLRQTNANSVVMRNYDPQTLESSASLNSVLFTYVIDVWPPPQDYFYAVAFPTSSADVFVSVADGISQTGAEYPPSPGSFFTALTYDDVGGLRYLLSTNNINYETLPLGVIGAGTNAASFLNGARRPGVDKITLVAHPTDPQSGAFLPWTNYFTDSYYLTNGNLAQQQLARSIPQPDILFTADDVVTKANLSPLFARTDCSYWSNNAAANGNTNGTGPGVIHPPVRIAFEKLGPFYFLNGTEVDQSSSYWGSFDATTNPPVVYPIAQAATNQLTCRLWLDPNGAPPGKFEWKGPAATGALFDLQTSTDLANWTTLFTVTNNGSVATCANGEPFEASRFYRLIPH